jgi:hypothetical protein
MAQKSDGMQNVSRNMIADDDSDSDNDSDSSEKAIDWIAPTASGITNSEVSVYTYTYTHVIHLQHMLVLPDMRILCKNCIYTVHDSVCGQLAHEHTVKRSSRRAARYQHACCCCGFDCNVVYRSIPCKIYLIVSLYSKCKLLLL